MPPNDSELAATTKQQLVARMQMGPFSKESLLPIVKAFQPEIWLRAHQIVAQVIASESEAGRIVTAAPGIWDRPKPSWWARLCRRT